MKIEMKPSFSRFEKDLKVHLENTFNASAKEDDIEKISQTEETVLEFTKNYLEKYGLTFKDVHQIIESTLDEFAKSKIILR